MEVLLNGVARAVRSLVRSPSFTVPAVLILALTLGAATAIFSVVDGVLLRPLPLPDSEELVALCESHATLRDACRVSPPNLEDLRAETRTLESMGLARGWFYDMDDGSGEAVGVDGGIVTPSYFRTLGVEAHLGRLFAEDEVGPDRDGVVVLSHGLWTSRFGADPSVIGRTVALDGEPAVVVGVLPTDFEAPRLEWIRLWRPLHLDPLDEEHRGWRGFTAVGRLAEDASVEDVRAELGTLYAGLGSAHEEVSPEWRLQVRPLIHQIVGDTRPALWIFLGAVGLLLLIGCANVVNLLLARSLRRGRERAVRQALGAGRARVVGGVMTESALVALAGGALGLVLSVALVRLFLALAPPGIPRLDGVEVDLRVAGFAFLLSLGTALLFGTLPAARSAGGDLVDRLRGTRGSDGRRASRLRSGLVVLELALSLVLLASAGLLGRSFARFLAWDPGFETEGLLMVSAYAPPARHPTREDLAALFGRAEQRLAAIPGITSVGMTSAGPLFGGRESYRVAAGEAPPAELDALPTARWFDVSPTYHRTLGVPLLAGRWLQEGDGPGAEPVALVNETLARRLWPGQEALGRTLRVPERELSFRVAGVVGDVQPIVPGEAPEPEIYWSNRQFPRPFPFYVVRVAGDPAAASAAVRDGLLEVEPNHSVGTFTTMRESMARRMVRPRFNLTLLGAFAGAAVVLAAVGLYALLAFVVAQRLREMGIRIALGSTPAGVVRQILREGGVLVAAGLALGLVGTVAASTLVRRIVYGVEPTDPATLATTALALAGVALLAGLVPALRAGRADPGLLLREE